MILFINACVRKQSRTKRLADRFLAGQDGQVREVRLQDVAFPRVDEAWIEKRDRLLREGRVEDPMLALARQFAEADEIVIAAPCWDLSFPAALKQYLEQICVVGVTFRYTEDGVPTGLCRAKRLTYLTTVGGDFFPPAYGFGYVEALARTFFGIGEVRLIKAEGLDVVGADVEAILRCAEEAIEKQAGQKSGG